MRRTKVIFFSRERPCCGAVRLTEGVVVTTNGSYHRRHVPVKEKRQIRKLADFPEACWKLNLNPHPLKNQMPKGAPPKKSQMQSKVNGVAHPPVPHLRLR